MNDFLNRMGILGELLGFLWRRKLYWLIPMMMMLGVVALFLLLSNNPVTGPFIYSLF
jgi:hypothetical protein